MTSVSKYLLNTISYNTKCNKIQASERSRVKSQIQSSLRGQIKKYWQCCHLNYILTTLDLLADEPDFCSFHKQHAHKLSILHLYSETSYGSRHHRNYMLVLSSSKWLPQLPQPKSSLLSLDDFALNYYTLTFGWKKTAADSQTGAASLE
jgi:hypothetical protein